MNRWAKYVLVIGVVIVALILTRDILAPFVLAIATAYVVSPLVDRAQRMSRLPRVLVIALFYLLFLGTLTLLGALVEPELAQAAERPLQIRRYGRRCRPRSRLEERADRRFTAARGRRHRTLQ